jgi:hypothetical protein
MAKKKKKKTRPQKRASRIARAKTWLPTYEGTRVVRAYRKKFGVDTVCAVRELQEIGHKFEPGYVENLLKSEAARIEQLRKKKEEKREAEEYNEWQDDNFYYIAGYTSGGAPYGVTWSEMGLEPWENEFDDEEEWDGNEENDGTTGGCVCPLCKSDMTKVAGCTLSVFMYKGREYERFKVGGAGDFFEGADAEAMCGDCGSKYGHYHHYGCDCEYCPVCGGQLITCGCEVRYKKN